MAIPVQKFREIVFQLLFSSEMGHASMESMVELLSKELAVTKKNVREAQERVRAIVEAKEAIDAQIAQASYAYAFERIQSVEKNILRLAVFELLFDQGKVPPKAVIAEALRLTRKFSTKEAAGFVNAILDAIYRASQGETIDEAELVRRSKELQKMEKRIKDTIESDREKHEP